MFRHRNYLVSGPFVDLQNAVETLTKCDTDSFQRCRDDVLKAMDVFAADLKGIERPKKRYRDAPPESFCLSCETMHPNTAFRCRFTCQSHDKRFIDLYRAHKNDLKGASDLNRAVFDLFRIRAMFPRREIKPVVMRNKSVVFEIENEIMDFEDWVKRRDELNTRAQTIRCTTRNATLNQTSTS